MSYPYCYIALSQDCYNYFMSLNVNEDLFEESWIGDEISYSEFLELWNDFKSNLAYTPSNGYGIYIPGENTSWTVDWYISEFIYDLGNETCGDAIWGDNFNVVYSSTQAYQII